MNEKIKQLVDKAWKERDLITESRSLDEAFTSKFAELVIKDLAQFCYDSTELRVEQAYNLRKEIFNRYDIK